VLVWQTFGLKKIRRKAHKKQLENRATGLACCLADAWWPARPGRLTRLNFEILIWPDPFI